MWFRSLLASWKSRISRNPRPRPQPAGRGTRLVLEHLEDRALPSAYSAASVSDLIADITAANKAGGTNTITLTAPTTSPYALTAYNNGSNAYGVNGLPVIAANDNLTIVGSGDTIDRTVNPIVGFRFFGVAPNASLTLQNLTLQGGVVNGTTAVKSSGGAIYNLGALTLSSVTVANNQAYEPNPLEEPGGKLVGEPGYGGGIWSNGSLTLENGTVLEGNDARGSPGGSGFGGAVYIAGGTANITNTTFGGLGSNKNQVIGGGTEGNAYGGALYVAAGQVILTNDTVNNNWTVLYGEVNPKAYGAGVYVAGGTVTLASDTVESNLCYFGGGYGGGLCVAGGTVTLINDTVESNSSTYGGGIYIVGGTVTLESTTVESNTAGYDSGGIYIAGGIVTLESATVEFNTAADGPGGGIYITGGTVTLENDTIQSNTAQGSGGGLFIASAATVYLDSFTVANTINNTDNTGLNGSTANIDGTYILQNP